MTGTAVTTVDTLTAQMSIPAFDNTVLSDVLRVIRGTITTAAQEAKDGDVVAAGRRAKAEAIKQLKNAMFLPSLTATQEKALLNRTGLRYAQVNQFGREDSMSLTATVASWFPVSTKKVGKVAASGELDKLRGVVQDMPVDLFQHLTGAGVMAGDTVTIKVGVKTSAMTLDRGGKKVYALHNAETGELSKATATDAREVGQANMRLGRARRIARELKARAGEWSALPKGDIAWLAKDGNRLLTETQYKKLLG